MTIVTFTCRKCDRSERREKGDHGGWKAMWEEYGAARDFTYTVRWECPECQAPQVEDPFQMFNF